MPMYRPSEAVATVILAKPINTTTTLEIRGSDDEYTTDRREFSTEEIVRVNGSVTAADGANLSAASVEIYLDRVLKGRATLTYDAVARNNLYVYEIGYIAEGTHEIRIYFPRFRTFSPSAAQATIGVPYVTPWEKLKTWWDSLTWWQKLLVVAGSVGAVGGAIYGAKKLLK